MSVEQSQREVNRLDEEIAKLEKKKSEADTKAAKEREAAARRAVRKNDSASAVASKLKDIARHDEAARKEDMKSADLQKQIASKRAKRNDAYTRLQREQKSQAKKEQQQQKRAMDEMRHAYEDRIEELERNAVPNVTTPFGMTSETAKQYDVFVSHATEDKESFVNELVAALQNFGVNVWYDATEIGWGDSLRKRIDEGIRLSRFGIVVLSPDYIADGKYWTGQELDSLFQKESATEKVLLPVWHNLTKKQVLEYSPLIAGKRR